MKKQWTASPKQLAKINELIVKSHRVRRRLLKRQVGSDESWRVDNIPDIVIPPMLHKRRSNSWNNYTQYLRELKYLKTLYKDEDKSFFKWNYKRVILDAFLTAINSEGTFGKGKTEIKPEGMFRMFDKEQIKNADSRAEKEAMKLYNALNRLPIQQFTEMYKRGFIVQFRWIYREMLDSSDARGGPIAEQFHLLKDFRRIMKQRRRGANLEKGSHYHEKRMLPREKFRYQGVARTWRRSPGMLVKPKAKKGKKGKKK